jgi:hypothetical protein
MGARVSRDVREAAVQLDTLISPEEAERALRFYEAQVRDERTDEDAAIAAGYRAASRGQPVVMLPQVMTAGGWFDNGLPRLAICRADASECWVRVHRPWTSTAGVPHEVTFSDQPDERGHVRVGRHRVQVSMPAPAVTTNAKWRAHTVVPLVPPQHRPKRTRLHLFHVLWEVEEWTAIPPRDPALLRHIRGDLWSVVATWDLTELERAVLSQRAR